MFSGDIFFSYRSLAIYLTMLGAVEIEICSLFDFLRSITAY